MHAADTNVLTRLLVVDDRAQQRTASARLKAIRNAGDTVRVSVVALAELTWVLESGYG